MKFNISKEWLLASTEDEDKLPVSVGAPTFVMIANDCKTESQMVAEQAPNYVTDEHITDS